MQGFGFVYLTVALGFLGYYDARWLFPGLLLGVLCEVIDKTRGSFW